MRFSLLASIFLVGIFNINLSANENFKPGYVVLLNGDTVHGYLLIQNSQMASKFCMFKGKEDGTPVKYNAGEIFGYRYSGDKYYISKKIHLDSTSYKTVFFEYLLNGISDFYYYKDDHGDHYYIEKETVGIVELTEDLRTYDGVKIIPSRFKGKLRWIMEDCSDIESAIEKTSLDHKSLINLGKSYHEKVCTTETCIIYERSNLGVNYKLGVVAGISMNRYNFGTRILSNYAPGFQVGLEMKVRNLFHSNEKFALAVKLLLEKDSKYLLKPASENTFNYMVTYNGAEYSIMPGNEFGTIQSLSVYLNVVDFKIPVVLNYHVPLKKSSLYIGLGLSDKIVIYQNKKYIDHMFVYQYGKSINSFLAGGIANIGFDKSITKEKELGINFSCEYLIAPSAINTILRLRETQFTFQLIYTFR